MENELNGQKMERKPMRVTTTDNNLGSRSDGFAAAFVSALSPPPTKN